MKLNLTALRDAMGLNDTVIDRYRESVNALQQAVGKNHPDTARALNQLASCLLRKGDDDASLHARHESRRAIRNHLVRMLPNMSRSAQQAYITEFAHPDLEEALSHGLKLQANPQAVEMSAEWLLNAKASVEEALADADLLQRADVLPLTRNLRVVQSQIAKLELLPTASVSRQSQRLNELKERQDEVLRELNKHRVSPAYDENWVPLQTVRKKLPSEAIFVNFAKLNVRDFWIHDGESKWQAARYVAWVIPSGKIQKIKLVDLGDAATIDAKVSALRTAIQTAPAELAQSDEATAFEKFNQLSKALSQQILDPLLPLLEGHSELLISPDDQLWTVPWAALPLKDEFLIEKFQIRLLISGRELLHESASKSEKGTTVCIRGSRF